MKKSIYLIDSNSDKVLIDAISWDMEDTHTTFIDNQNQIVDIGVMPSDDPRVIIQIFKNIDDFIHGTHWHEWLIKGIKDIDLAKKLKKQINTLEYSDKQADILSYLNSKIEELSSKTP